MIITNRANLPEPIVRAIKNDRYSKGGADFSVTEIFSPPQIARLKKQHHAELSEDASDRIWSLLGSATHEIIDRANNGTALQEIRLFATINGYSLSGQVDMYDPESHAIYDWKVTSAWKILSGDFSDWTNQLNAYAALTRINGGEVKHLSIIAILRDWSKHRARESADYPQSQVVEIKIDVMKQDDAIVMIMDRLRLHAALETQPCTDKERWMKPDQFAVMKGDNKRATRVFDSAKDAEDFIQSAGGTLRIDIRRGSAIRCADYCPVAPFCKQWKELNHES